MSTICKIDRTVRDARTRRRVVLREVEQMSRDPRIGAHDRVLMLGISTELRTIYRAPYRDGISKERAFERILKRERISQPVL